MFIKDYISKDYPCFSLTDSIESARDTLEAFGYSHIFIKKSHHFYGALAQDFLYEEEGTLKDLEHQIERFAILEDNNIMDSIRLFYTFNTNVIPVINKAEKYVGYIRLRRYFSGSFKISAVFGIRSHSYRRSSCQKILHDGNCKYCGK